MNNKKWRNFFYDFEEEKDPKYDPNLSLISETLFDSLDLTHLSESEIKLLMEGRKENVMKKYRDLIDEESLDTIIEFDEQYKYKHLMWLAKVLSQYDYDEQQMKIDDLVSAISDFVKYSQLMKRKDINVYKNLEELLDAIESDVIQRRIKKARKERDKGRRVSDQLLNTGQAAVIYEDDRYFVVRPETTEASCFFGAKTRWCIAQSGNSYFGQYTEGEGKIFYFIKDDSKTNDEYNHQMALEISLQGEELYYDNVWDRFDDAINVDSSNPSDLVVSLVEYLEFSDEAAEAIVEAIEEHAMDNPPESPMAELESRINNGDYDGGFVNINANLEVYDSPAYLMISARVSMRIPIENERALELLNNDEFDIDQAEESIKEAILEDGELFAALKEEVDIGASEYWMPQDDDLYEVDIVRADDTWVIDISIDGIHDSDSGGYYTDRDEAIRFCEYMEEEWGERNEGEIEEFFHLNIYRYIPQIAAEGAEEFRSLKNKFATGQHEVLDNRVYYSVDDEDDENSDLNLFMEFKYNLSEEFTAWLYGAEEFKNASGNIVMKRTNSSHKASGTVRNMLRRNEGTKGFLEKAIYNVYQSAVAFASKQLKLDFGPEFNFDDDLEMPSIPTGINIQISVLENQENNTELVPYGAELRITYSVYIPFHQSPQELKAILNFFTFIRDNYDEISSYIYKYIHIYSPPMSGGQYLGNPRPEQILAENLYYDILDSQMFLKSLKDQMRLLKP